LRLARREPATLVIGVDTNAAAMREASDRASRKPARGGVPNAIFLAGTLDELACLVPLVGAVNEVRVTLPWGSLLSAAATPDTRFVRGLRALLMHRGWVRMLLSVTLRDTTNDVPLLGDESLQALVARYRTAGLRIATARRANAADVEELGSSWARRLGIPRQREAWLLVGEPVEAS
jgi:16S rRNA (adenine(1408)-N(1))-methyltransferase